MDGTLLAKDFRKPSTTKGSNTKLCSSLGGEVDLSDHANSEVHQFYFAPLTGSLLSVGRALGVCGAKAV